MIARAHGTATAAAAAVAAARVPRQRSHRRIVQQVGGFFGPALRKDAVALLVLRRRWRHRPQVAGVFADLDVDLNGVVVSVLDDGGRLAESCQLIPARLDRTRTTDAVAFARPFHQLLDHLYFSPQQKTKELLQHWIWLTERLLMISDSVLGVGMIVDKFWEWFDWKCHPRCAEEFNFFLDFGYLMFMPGPQINVNECYLNS